MTKEIRIELHQKLELLYRATWAVNEILEKKAEAEREEVMLPGDGAEDDDPMAKIQVHSRVRDIGFYSNMLSGVVSRRMKPFSQAMDSIEGAEQFRLLWEEVDGDMMQNRQIPATNAEVFELFEQYRQGLLEGMFGWSQSMTGGAPEKNTTMHEPYESMTYRPLVSVCSIIWS